MNPDNSSSSTTSKRCSIRIVSKIGHSTQPIYKVIEANQTPYALKLFPFQGGQPNFSYINEKRFSNLKHKNIISVVKTQDQQKSCHRGETFYSSYIMMEFCPYGDFSSVLTKTRIFTEDSKLARTYFHQLIEGIDFLHSNGVSHMDLKLDNLLLSKDFTLKITDFDCAYLKRDITILCRGTRNYRAPELRAETCEDTQAADIFSAGIILFVLRTGTLPYKEDSHCEGHNLYKMLMDQDPEYWAVHRSLTRSKVHLEEEFKELFISMIKLDIVDRATIEDVKKSKWYNGPIYTQTEVQTIMTNLDLGLINQEYL